MDENFTRFLHYYQIDTSSADLYADAYGYECRLNEIMPDSRSIIKKPDDKIIRKLLLDIDKVVNEY
ncbi:MAG: hypothetical protein U9N72_08850 [Bacteroidota bacterium]|nr:hypothetical protein [Bacteroidota bacterium]